MRKYPWSSSWVNQVWTPYARPSFFLEIVDIFQQRHQRRCPLFQHTKCKEDEEGNNQDDRDARFPLGGPILAKAEEMISPYSQHYNPISSKAQTLTWE